MPPKIPLGPLLTLIATTGFCVTAISFTHYAPIRDKEEMRRGVKRDKEIERMRRSGAAAGDGAAGGGSGSGRGSGDGSGNGN
jgi:hypothetical protein